MREVAPPPAAVAATAGSVTPAPGRRPWVWLAVAAAATVGALVIALRWTRRPETLAPNDPEPVIAVGRIVSYGPDPSTAALVGPVADLLATSLARSALAKALHQGRENVLVFVKNEADLEKALGSLAKRLTPTTNLWIAYRKGDKTLHRDTLWKHGEAFGLTGVSLVAVDDTWSAMRFKSS
jgi:hypothetical protein